MSEDYKHNPDKYLRYRPNYPPELFSWLAENVEHTECAWDCATGSGQAAQGLAEHFEKVIATDVNQSQLDHAAAHERIEYLLSAAESTEFESNSFDLVTCACAVHWFNQQEFYKEVSRVARPQALVALWTYEWPWLGVEELDSILRKLKDEILGDYWPEASQLYFNRYQTLDFPFEEISGPDISIRCSWGVEELLGFISTWSAPQRYLRAHQQNVTDGIRAELKNAWRSVGKERGVNLPLYFRVGRVSNEYNI